MKAAYEVRVNSGKMPLNQYANGIKSRYYLEQKVCKNNKYEMERKTLIREEGYTDSRTGRYSR